MSSNGGSNGLSPLLESHENRLSGMEDKIDSMSDRLAVTEVKIDVIEHKIDDGVHQINNKIDCLLSPVQNLNTKVASLEAHREAQLNKSKWANKVITALIIAGGGAIIEFIINHLL